MAEDNADIAKLIGRAVAFFGEGRTAEAKAACLAVLDIDPGQPDAFHFLGLMAYQEGDLENAAESISKAIAVNDGNPDYHVNLGKILKELGRLAEAEDRFRNAVALGPENAENQFFLGNILKAQERNAEAEPYLRDALALRPDFLSAGNSLGIVLEEQGRTKEAEAVYRQILEIGGEEETLYYNLGNVLKDQHRADEAIAAFRRAIELKPDYHWAHVHLAFSLLLKGDFPAGWREYEHRWNIARFGELTRGFAAPLWDGGDLDGSRILVHAEQGFGDTLHFVRYVRLAAAKGGDVILECQSALARVMETTPGASQVVAKGGALPEFDCHVPLLGMPHLLGTTLETVPAEVPYLFAAPGPAAEWAGRLAGTPGLKVGIAWQGRAEIRGNPGRACPLSAFKPLLDNPDVSLFSLQKEPPAEDLPLPDGLTDLSSEMNDFADTAAIMSALDLIVSIDTATAHLAGALGCRTWLLLSTAGDWRWLMERSDSPWYPSMRIFRQTRERDWEGVLQRVADALTAAPRSGG